MKRSIFIGSILASIILTVLLYRPVSSIWFRISEPNYKCPINVKLSKLKIRSDAHGDGTFGAKRRNGRTHAGIDIYAPIGTEVYASKSGIAFPGNVPTGYGKYVMIYHYDGTQTMYGHLLSQNVYATQKVRRGDLIGFVGKTGNANSKSIDPHLHFEIKKRGEPVDPMGLMR